MPASRSSPSTSALVTASAKPFVVTHFGKSIRYVDELFGLRRTATGNDLDEVFDACHAMASRLGIPAVTMSGLQHRLGWPEAKVLDTVRMWIQLGTFRQGEEGWLFIL